MAEFLVVLCFQREVIELVFSSSIFLNIFNPSLLELSQSLESLDLSAQQVMKLFVVVGKYCFILLLIPNCVKHLDVVHRPVSSCIRVTRQERLVSLVHLQLHIGVLFHDLSVNFVFFRFDGKDNRAQFVLDSMVV